MRGESRRLCESCSAATDSRCCAAQAANAQSGAPALRKTWLAPKKYDNVIPGPVPRVIRIGRRDRILCAQETLSMAVAASASKPAGNTGSIAIIGLLFFIFGFVTWLNGPLISFAKLAFDVSETLAFLIPSAFYISYFCLALPSSWVLRRTGMKKGMALGLFVMAVGAVVFGQYTTLRVYPGAVAGVFVIGAGLAILQTAANPYISILGPIESAAQRIAVMGICNKAAGILAPLLIGTLVMHGMGDLSAEVAGADAAGREALLQAFAARVHTPYMVMAGLLALLAVGIVFSPLPEIRAEDANAESAGGAGRRGLLQFPHVWLGALCIFVYVGVEVMAGDAIGIYGQGFDLPLDQTKFFTSFTLGAMLVGYLVGLVAIP